MKKLLLLLITAQAFGGISADKKYKLNHYLGQVAEEVALGTLVAEGGTNDLAIDGHQSQHLVVGTYDFAVNAGASTSLQTHHLGVSIPDNAVITRAFLDVVTAPVGQGANIRIGTENNNDILASTAITSITGQVNGTPDNTAANMKKMTAVRGLVLGILNTTLTAGKIKVYVEYVMSE